MQDFVSAVKGLPLPGQGHTVERLLSLADLGRQDPVLARLAEGHADATAILAEIGADVGDEAGGAPWGVWAAMPQAVSAVRDGADWQLTGDRPWCSGAAVCRYALVTARADDGDRLFAVDLSQPGVRPLDGTWPAVGMARSDSRTVRFDRVRADAVGNPGQYVGRPGFWHGGIGVAACWYGGAVGVADTLLAAARQRDLGPHALAHLGAIDGLLTGARLMLLDAAARIDADPAEMLEQVAFRVRSVVESAATQVIDRVGRALGAAPLCQNGEHAVRVSDLTVYLRQSHAETDLAHLGALVGGQAGSAW